MGGLAVEGNEQASADSLHAFTRGAGLGHGGHEGRLRDDEHAKREDHDELRLVH